MRGNEWLRDAIIYHIMVDRFSTGNSSKDSRLAGRTSKKWMGGNLGGIVKNLDYLKDLGINTIYISPIYLTRFYHGYHILNFYEIDPHFGNKKELRRMVHACHEKGFRVILDIAPNHLSCKHPFFLDAQRNQKSRFRDWFVFSKWPDKYMCFMSVNDLPKINLRNPEAKEYVISAAEYWIKEFDIDGYRIDHAIGLPLGFMKEFKRRMVRAKKSFVLIGEVTFKGARLEHLDTFWILEALSVANRKRFENSIRKRDVVGANEMVMDITRKLGVLDGCLDFVFMDLAWEHANNKLSFKDFKLKVDNHLSKFGSQFYLPLAVSNHDRGRLLFALRNESSFKKVLEYQFSLEQPQIIYYGDEIDLPQKKRIQFNVQNYSDIEARRFMVWNRSKKQEEMFQFFRSLCLRRESV